MTQPKSDPQARFDAITDQVLTYAERTMRAGSAKTKTEFIRSVYPALHKLFVEDSSDGGMAELRDTFTTMMGEAFGTQSDADDPEGAQSPGS